MKTILAVQSYPGANEAVARHWPYYEASGADVILGIGTEGGGCKWPGKTHHVNIAPNGYITDGHLPQRLIDTIEYALEFTTNHDDRIAVIEYDVLFFNPLPPLCPGFHAQHAGGLLPPMLAKKFYHSPWVFDAATAVRVVKKGNAMLQAGVNERGNPDFFIGLLCEWFDIPAYGLANCYTQNTLNIPEKIAEARELRRSGRMVAVHGCKTPEQLAYLLT